MKYGLTTRILHSDHVAGAEHGAVHKPMHTAAAYTQGSARDLAAVFKGDQSGYVYARQGNPTGAALEAKINLLEESRATACITTGMAAIAAALVSQLRRGDRCHAGGGCRAPEYAHRVCRDHCQSAHSDCGSRRHRRALRSKAAALCRRQHADHAGTPARP